MTDSIHGDATETVPVSARRFEQSPFEHRWKTDQTIMGVYAGRYYATYNGEDVDEGYWTLRRRAVLYDVPERPVEISGPDAARFLDRVLSRRVGDLGIGRARYSIACTHEGRMFMDGILFRLGDSRYWYVQPDGALETWLLAHSPGFDVAVTDPRSRVLQIQGPASLEILRAVTNSAAAREMGYFHAGFFRIGGQEVFVSRTGWTGELGFEIYTQGDATDCDQLWDHVFAIGEQHGMIFGSLASMEIRRIEAGILDNQTDFDLSMTPFEAGLGQFVDLDKGDFVGRDALRTATHGKRLFGLRCREATPTWRGAIRDGNDVVGHVTAGAYSPFLQAGVGYARFNAVGEWAGRELTVEIATGRTAACEILDLPFYDNEKRIPRGLEVAGI